MNDTKQAMLDGSGAMCANKPAGMAALGTMDVGFVGRVEAVQSTGDAHGLTADEMERRLIELGFVEGARVAVLHEGLFGRDPIAVRVEGITVALRRREAMMILVRPAGEAP